MHREDAQRHGLWIWGRQAMLSLRRPLVKDETLLDTLTTYILFPRFFFFSPLPSYSLLFNSIVSWALFCFSLIHSRVPPRAAVVRMVFASQAQLGRLLAARPFPNLYKKRCPGWRWPWHLGWTRH